MNRFYAVGAKLTQVATMPVTQDELSRAARGFITTLQHTMTVIGLSAVFVLTVLYFRPDLAREVAQVLHTPEPQLSAPPLFELMDGPQAAAEGQPEAPTGAAAKDKALAASIKQQQFVTDWLSRRYRVSTDATNMLVSTAYTTADEMKLDPLLILAVMAIESGFNPFAESPVGAQGLMQVMSKVHHDKFEEMGGVQAALNPVANIRVGARILKDYVTRGGSVEAGLKSYVGAAAFETDFGYGARVLAEYNKLKLVAMGKRVPIYNRVKPAPVPVAVPPGEQPQVTPAQEPVAEPQIAGI